MRPLPCSLAACALSLLVAGCCQTESKFEHGKDAGVSYASASVSFSAGTRPPVPPSGPATHETPDAGPPPPAH